MAPAPMQRQVATDTLRSFGSARTLVLGLSRVVFASLSAAPAVSASPLPGFSSLARRSSAWLAHEGTLDAPEDEANLWVLLLASLILVLLGGAFAGLTIALMGQDSIYLQVLSRDDTDPKQKNAKRVYDLLQRGKHWVLVTLLLSNVIVNETLPVVLDRCLGGGVAAVVGSTLLIVVFGEVLPQSVCVRYGLEIGGIMAKPVLALMWLMAPVAWPTAKVLDHALGEDHGTVYKKSGLKTLVTLHRSLGEVSERLNQDEVTIISAVLDLKEKPVSSVMTPMEDVFTMSETTVLDEKMMDLILSAGYSRIPIHEPLNPTNFVGMLLVKILITYDPDDKMRVSEFPLATLPETRPETSCLDLVNFFQEGKSHMILVSQYPGEDHGALGVVTLEDVIEELIGEEIIDESDVYIDVHKAIRRLQPAPRARLVRKPSVGSEPAVTASTQGAAVADEADIDAAVAVQHQHQHGVNGLNALAKTRASKNTAGMSTSPKMATLMMRRSSTGADGQTTMSTVPVRANIDEMWQHLRHLGPSNRATNPKNTRSATVKIKTGIHGRRLSMDRPVLEENQEVVSEPAEMEVHENEPESDAEETTRLLSPKPASSNGGYGTGSGDRGNPVSDDATPSGFKAMVPILSTTGIARSGSGIWTTASPQQENANVTARPNSGGSVQEQLVLDNAELGMSGSRRQFVRSGSITENVIETRGIRKVVLQTTSSTEEEDGAVYATGSEQQSRHQRNHTASEQNSPAANRTVSDTETCKSGRTPQEAAAAAATAGTEAEPAAALRRDSFVGNSDGPGNGNEGSVVKKKNRRKKRKNAK